MSKEWSIGDVIRYNDNTIVILDVKNREDCRSTCYDRDYKICRLSDIENQSILSEGEFNKIGYWISIIGKTKFPEYENIEIIAPFEIKQEKVYRIRQKNPITKIKYI